MHSPGGIHSKQTQSTTAETDQRKLPQSFALKKTMYKLDRSEEDLSCHIELDIDTADAFDYEDANKAKFTIQDLQQLVLNEVEYYENR